MRDYLVKHAPSVIVEQIMWEKQQSAGLAVYELPRSLMPLNRFARYPELCYREECHDGRDDAQRILDASARYCGDFPKLNI